MSVHLSTPAAPQTASCGDAGAKRFTFWRWKATCALCKLATAAVAFDKTQRADTTYRADLPIRYSALVRFVSNLGGMTGAALAEFERDKKTACAKCASCKRELYDPIALFDVKANRMLFACPWCSEAKMRERWEAEAPK